MSDWPSAKASRVFAALRRIGWNLKRTARGSCRVLDRDGWPDCIWHFHDDVEIGPVMMKKIAKHTGLTPKDL